MTPNPRDEIGRRWIDDHDDDNNNSSSLVLLSPFPIPFPILSSRHHSRSPFLSLYGLKLMAVLRIGMATVSVSASPPHCRSLLSVPSPSPSPPLCRRRALHLLGLGFTPSRVMHRVSASLTSSTEAPAAASGLSLEVAVFFS